MTVFLHELKRGRLSLLIWTVSIAFMLSVCIIIYPEMAKEMEGITDIFANMGSFSDAFGLDQLNFGEFMGYFAIECGNTLGLGGALFAAILGISALSKEERDHTAEFLFSHPISRRRVITEKLLSVYVTLLIFNAVVMAISLVMMLVIGVDADFSKVLLLFLANLLMQIEIASITFGISAYLSKNGLGIGLGISFFLYFLNILANLTKELDFLKYITPFAYTDGADIIQNATLDGSYLIIGAILSACCIWFSYFKFLKKDLT